MEEVHKGVVKWDADQIWAPIAWALLVVKFLLWLCVPVILGEIGFNAVFFLLPESF